MERKREENIIIKDKKKSVTGQKKVGQWVNRLIFRELLANLENQNKYNLTFYCFCLKQLYIFTKDGILACIFYIYLHHLSFKKIYHCLNIINYMIKKR